jgi:two-component system cell cycle response regulator CtrA
MITISSLLDLNLPDMHGYEVLKKLRVAKVQTLILSGIAENGQQDP